MWPQGERTILPFILPHSREHLSLCSTYIVHLVLRISQSSLDWLVKEGGTTGVKLLSSKSESDWIDPLWLWFKSGKFMKLSSFGLFSISKVSTFLNSGKNWKWKALSINVISSISKLEYELINCLKMYWIVSVRCLWWI